MCNGFLFDTSQVGADVELGSIPELAVGVSEYLFQEWVQFEHIFAPQPLPKRQIPEQRQRAYVELVPPVLQTVRLLQMTEQSTLPAGEIMQRLQAVERAVRQFHWLCENFFFPPSPQSNSNSKRKLPIFGQCSAIESMKYIK